MRQSLFAADATQQNRIAAQGDHGSGCAQRQIRVSRFGRAGQRPALGTFGMPAILGGQKAVIACDHRGARPCGRLYGGRVVTGRGRGQISATHHRRARQADAAAGMQHNGRSGVKAGCPQFGLDAQAGVRGGPIGVQRHAQDRFGASGQIFGFWVWVWQGSGRGGCRRSWYKRKQRPRGFQGLPGLYRVMRLHRAELARTLLRVIQQRRAAAFGTQIAVVIIIAIKERVRQSAVKLAPVQIMQQRIDPCRHIRRV